MRAIEFIFESYPLAKKEFSQVAKPDVVQSTIDQYRELVRKNQFRNPEEKNINHWRERGWEAFSQMVKIKSSDVTDTQLKKGNVVSNAITLQDDDEWLVVIPLDKETSVHYGRGTEWCTTKPYWAYFEEYVYESNITLIYAIDKTKGGRSVAISIKPPNTWEGEQIEMFNQNDDLIDASRYKQISELDSEKFIQMAKLPENQQQLTASVEKYKVAKAKTVKLLRARPLDPEAIERELKFTKNTDDCYTYIVAYGQEQNSRVRVHPSIVVAVSNHDTPDTHDDAGQYIDFTNIPLGVIRSILRTTPKFIYNNIDSLSPPQKTVVKDYETTITSDPKKSYEYAEQANNPFPAGEAAIATSAKYSCKYAVNVLKKKPFPAGEAAIATDPEYSHEYATEVLKKPFPAGEAAIATNAYYSLSYAVNSLKHKPFPAGEPAISANNDMADNYTRYIIKYHHSDTWENLIKNNAEQSYNYAVLVLDAPFPAGEPAIAESTEWAFRYTDDVLKNHRSKTWENLIKNDAKKSYEYAKARKQLFPAGEAAIAADPKYAAQYDQLFGTTLAQQTHI